MPFWEDDIDEFLQDFVVTVTLDPGDTDETDIDAIFDESQEVYDMQTGQIVNAGPFITCKSTDVSGVSLGDDMTINSTTYYAREILDDGTGITKIRVSTQ